MSDPLKRLLACGEQDDGEDDSPLISDEFLLPSYKTSILSIYNIASLLRDLTTPQSYRDPLSSGHARTHQSLAQTAF